MCIGKKFVKKYQSLHLYQLFKRERKEKRRKERKRERRRKKKRRRERGWETLFNLCILIYDDLQYSITFPYVVIFLFVISYISF